MIIRKKSLFCTLSALFFAPIACSDDAAQSDTGGPGGMTTTGGLMTTGGMTTTSGTPTTGGVTTTGGTPTTGGVTTTGGTPTTGGVTTTGGITTTGGTPTTGGTTTTGSATTSSATTTGAGAGGAATASSTDTATTGGAPEFHVYLAVGQSNMQGAAHIPADPPFHERVQVMQSETCPNDGHSFTYGQWRELFQPIVMCKEGTRPLPNGGGEAPIGLGPADSFAVAMAEASGSNVTIGIVGAAHGDTSITQHLPGCTSNCLPSWGNNISGAPVINGTTPLFEWVVDLAKKAQEMGEIKGIIFHQGENDAGNSSWPQNVNTYVTALREELGLDPAKVPFIAGELPRTGGSAASHNPLVQQIPNVVENGHFVSSGPMEDGTVLGDRGDGIHWSTESVIEMGKRYAAKMLEAQAAAQ